MSDSGRLPSAEEIHATHEVVEEMYSLKHTGVRVRFPDRKLKMVLERAREEDDLWMRAAVLLKGIKRVHVYEDGNKRTAWLTVLDYLDRHGVEPKSEGERVELVMKRIDRFTHTEIATWLTKGSIEEVKLR